MSEQKPRTYRPIELRLEHTSNNTVVRWPTDMLERMCEMSLEEAAATYNEVLERHSPVSNTKDSDLEPA
ncbi:MAG: hypothetical protein WBG92_16290 [Thiohalocapsa sp.]